MAIDVSVVPWSSHREPLQWIREQVFIVEQEVPRDLEWDGQDEESCHFLAVDDDGALVGCARLLPDGQIGRMAVLPEWRGAGIGLRLLQAAIDEAAGCGLQQVFLHAQTHALEFYRRAGFRPVGEEFMEAGIPHRAMELMLPLAYEPPRQHAPAQAPAPPPPGDRGPAGEADSRRLRTISGETACRQALLECVQRARTQLDILSPALDHALFDQEALAAAVSALARSSERARIRILVEDVSAIVSRGHRLLELARRLDSRIEIRRADRSRDDDEDSFVTHDGVGYLRLPDYRHHQALVAERDPVAAQRLNERFQALWQRSSRDPELRTLRL